MIVRLLQKNGSGLLIITHDKEFAALVAEKGFAIQEGRLIAL
jgi:ABC-type polar amino acid transport system ATPase subunit